MSTASSFVSKEKDTEEAEYMKFLLLDVVLPLTSTILTRTLEPGRREQLEYSLLNLLRGSIPKLIVVGNET